MKQVKMKPVTNFKKKLHGPFLWMGFNCLKATATPRRQFTFYHSVPRNSWYSFYQPQKDERLSWPWSHPVVLNTVLLDWESSALTTRPLLHKSKTIYLFKTPELIEITRNLFKTHFFWLCSFSVFLVKSFSTFYTWDIYFKQSTSICIIYFRITAKLRT